MHFSGSNLTSKSGKLVDQSSRDLFPRKQEESVQKNWLLDILSRSGDIRNQSLTLQKIDRNFACFWPPVFFFGGGRSLNFWTWIYKIEPDSDHVAKFCGDRPRDLGEWALNKKKHHGQNISPSGTVVPGGLNS